MEIDICEDVAQALGELKAELNNTIKQQSKYVLELENWKPKKKKDITEQAKQLVYHQGILDGLKFAMSIVNDTKNNWTMDMIDEI